MKRVQFQPYQKLLTEEQQATLSISAMTLFAVIFNRMQVRAATEVSVANKEAAEIARCDAKHLEAVQAEIHRAGLLCVERLYNPKWRPGEHRSSYTWPDEPAIAI